MFKKVLDLLPPENEIVEVLTRKNFYVIQYYGRSLLGRLYSWIFWKRYEIIMEFLTGRARVRQCQRVLDGGCGAMFLAYALTRRFNVEYVGIDILPLKTLKQYKQLVASCAGKPINVVRASAEKCPFRSSVFHHSFLLDVLEHLEKPREAIKEISRINQEDGFIIVSLPLENVFTKFNRAVSFIIRLRMPKLKKEDHYVGDLSSYEIIVRYIEKCHEKIASNYSPLGIIQAINFSAIHFFRKKKPAECIFGLIK
jgi:SAM-dependent methyltransferase